MCLNKILMQAVASSTDIKQRNIKKDTAQNNRYEP